MLPTREEVEEVRRARLKAEAAAVTASRSSTPGRPATPGQAAGGAGTSPGGAANLQSPRLGPVEALFDALGRVPRLEQKMRVLSFRWAGPGRVVDPASARSAALRTGRRPSSDVSGGTRAHAPTA
jgi:hypothetical protein